MRDTPGILLRKPFDTLSLVDGSHALRPLESSGGRFSCREEAADVARSRPERPARGQGSRSLRRRFRRRDLKWRERGHLPVATDEQGREIRDKQGRPRYRLLDVAKAENATKRRGEQMARGITRRDPDQRIAA